MGLAGRAAAAPQKGLVGRGLPMRSATRLGQSRAWADESQGWRLPGMVFAPLGEDSKAWQAPGRRALPLAAPSVLGIWTRDLLCAYNWAQTG